MKKIKLVHLLRDGQKAHPISLPDLFEKASTFQNIYMCSLPNLYQKINPIDLRNIPSGREVLELEKTYLPQR